MSTIPRPDLMSALDLIEEAEARHLAWGLLDESWSREQLLDLLDDKWDCGDSESCLQQLESENLLFSLPRSAPVQYRTRMAETVRLFSRLRQLFPNRPWQTGSRLVSDIRFLRRPRMFSERTLDAESCLRELSVLDIPGPLVNEVSRLLSGRKLSRFQLDATVAVTRAAQSGADRGVVVSAGTGSGKTLAFYLPAMARMAAAGPTSPRAMAIYPRNELLKDQFVTALREVRSLRAAGGRKLTIGAYFGLTPRKTLANSHDREGWRWSKAVKRYICPFLKCPSVESDGSACDGQLVWDKPTENTASRNWGSLRCLKCKDRVTSDELRLTRDAMQADPPDILFTTSEMLNQQMSDGWSRHVFGLGGGSARVPDLILLDEIHTYTGTNGAQVAYLLRRWRKLLGKPVTWVGLSATLANAATFFADLCGLPADAVEDVRPKPADLKPQGSEYQLLLRGDPASQSALLSTTIQSLMLLRRVLEDNGDSLGKPFGSRVFAFLENLDLVNRLYRQLLSAEGRNPFGEVEGPGLAALRLLKHAESKPDEIDPEAWERDGQHWWLPESLGFDDRSLVVSRTSSQDTGVSTNADIIVATSSLEVGYDDPRVGAVLQHKAPRDIAQFLQRKGRAGRLQSQRPWTVVVLSDFGRDRLAFQSYETILDPSIPAKSLPLGNQAVRKMQAAMCLVDWIAVRLESDKRGMKWSPRVTLSSPPKNDGYEQLARARLAEIAALLDAVIEGGEPQRSLVDFVQSSLGLTDQEIWSVCWEHPRSLLLEAVPTARRRAASNWTAVDEDHHLVEKSDTTARHPLPEYIPSNLFSDLLLPEVDVEPPDDYDEAARTSLPVAMGLTELAPGKVTLRWAVRKVGGLWIDVPPDGVVDLDDKLAPGGDVVHYVTVDDRQLPLVRPTRLKPEKPGGTILPTSNGRLRWQLLIDSDAEGTPLPRPRTGPLGDLVSEVTAFLNVGRGPLRTWRFALGGTAEIVTRRTRERRDYTFTRQGEPAAVGFAAAVDALRMTVVVPSTVAEFNLHLDEERLRQLRTDRFTHLVKQGLEAEELDPFGAMWVTDVALSVAAGKILHGSDVADLVSSTPREWRELAAEVVDGVLLATTHSSIDETPLRDVVLDAIDQPRYTDVLRNAVSALVDDPSEEWAPWLRARFLQTVAAAWQSAAQQLCADFNVDTDAVVDVIDAGGPTAHIVLSDAVTGGGGLVETLTERIADDPRRFDSLVAGAAEPSDTEEVDYSLRRVLTLLADDPDVANAAATFRAGRGDRLASWQALIALISEKGVARSHATISALATRVFRPGSVQESDKLLRLLLRKWDEFDVRARFAIDHRAICTFLAEDEEVLALLKRIASPRTSTEWEVQKQSTLLSLLWTRACARRPETLRTSNRFVLNPPATERSLLRDVLPEQARAVDVDQACWREDVVSVLRTWGSARIFSSSDNSTVLSDAMRGLMVTPLEVDWLHVHPKLDCVLRENGRFSISMNLQEAPQ
ncbi:protein DpdJ [Amycolatopsis sp. NPDC051371]|uniref:protein DpdJ n=1 Tax=Amycolatopsis sp. NPDC051371 TaxID=3155800 RepID=UPI0034272FD6